MVPIVVVSVFVLSTCIMLLLKLIIPTWGSLLMPILWAVGLAGSSCRTILVCRGWGNCCLLLFLGHSSGSRKQNARALIPHSRFANPCFRDLPLQGPFLYPITLSWWGYWLRITTLFSIPLLFRHARALSTCLDVSVCLAFSMPCFSASLLPRLVFYQVSHKFRTMLFFEGLCLNAFPSRLNASSLSMA